MAVYKAPSQFAALFNPSAYISSSSTGLTLGEGDARYLQLTGGAVSSTLSIATPALVASSSGVGFGTSTPTSGFAVDVAGYIKTQQICFRAYKVWADASVTVNASLISTDSSVLIDAMPSTLSTTYGYQTTGTYAGTWRNPIAGVYRVTCMARFTDTTATQALQVMRFNGSTRTIIGEGLFAPTDGAAFSRRVAVWTDLVSLTSLNLGIYPTLFVTGQVSWCIFTVELVYAY